MWAPSPPAACGPPHRDRSCSLVCTSPEPPTTTPRRLPSRLRPGQRLALRRQPENRYDALAIEVLGPEGHKLGYVPRRRNEMPARLMDAGKRLSARTESIAQRGSWLNIQVSLYLDDA